MQRANGSNSKAFVWAPDRPAGIEKVHQFLSGREQFLEELFD